MYIVFLVLLLTTLAVAGMCIAGNKSPEYKIFYLIAIILAAYMLLTAFDIIPHPRGSDDRPTTTSV